MLIMTFINQYGQTFTTTSEELKNSGDSSPLSYIKYCLDRNSILVDLKVKGELE